MPLSLLDLETIAWYRTLDDREKEAVDRYLLQGDYGLILTLRNSSERLQRFHYFPPPDGSEQATLQGSQFFLL